MLRGAQIFVPLPCPSCGRVARARDEIGGYRLHELLKRSGLGVIFRAEDSAGGSLAVKIVQPACAAESTDIEYFVSEVWALARLNHPNCLRIFATGVECGVAWIAMEWLAHGSLAERLADRGRLREAEVLSIGVQVASALGAAAAADHTHRDLEPNNLVFADALTVKVTDFGQAALYQIAADDLGTMWGCTWYVSPERLRNEPEEAHSEIYSLGAVLFHALTGTPLHGGEPAAQITLELIESGEIRVQDFVDSLHEQTADILNRMLASEPSQRFQYWSEVVTQLHQAGALVARRDAPSRIRAPAPAKAPAPTTTPRALPSSRLPWALVTLAFVALTVAAGIFGSKHRPAPPPPQPAPAAPRSPAASPAPSPSPAPVAATPDAAVTPERRAPARRVPSIRK